MASAERTIVGFLNEVLEWVVDVAKLFSKNRGKNDVGKLECVSVSNQQLCTYVFMLKRVLAAI